MPFNVIHHHAIDEHRIAIASHQKNHHCEIDRNFCKDENASSCGHEHHLNIPIAKCFTCQFHFEKNYAAIAIFSRTIFSFQLNKHFISDTNAATLFAKLISNKGPPELS